MLMCIELTAKSLTIKPTNGCLQRGGHFFEAVIEVFEAAIEVFEAAIEVI
jgi:hypothetical protein